MIGCLGLFVMALKYDDTLSEFLSRVREHKKASLNMPEKSHMCIFLFFCHFHILKHVKGRYLLLFAL